jgi:hypothetical protein
MASLAEELLNVLLLPVMVTVLVADVPVMALNVTTFAVVSFVNTLTLTAPLTPLVPMAEAKADQLA